MHFVVIFLAIIWGLMSFGKEKMNSATIADAYRMGRNEAAEKYHIPPHLVAQLDKEKYNWYDEIKVCNIKREEEIFNETWDELNIGSLPLLLIRFDKGGHIDKWCIHPEPPQYTREEALKKGYTMEEYDKAEKLYARHEEKCNAEGFVTYHQKMRYHWYKDRVIDREMHKRIIK